MFFKKVAHKTLSKFTCNLIRKETPAQVFSAKFFKGATKSYYMQYACVVIALLNTVLCRCAFSTVSFRKLVFFVFLCFL